MTAENILPKHARPAASKFAEKMTQEQIRERFDAEVAAAYSQRKPVWLPEYAGSLNLITKVIKPCLALTKKPSVLDLGAGTGNLSRTVLEVFPTCQVTLVDFSANMLAEVPHVLAAFPDKYVIRQADFWEVKFPKGRFDAVVTSFALHHGRGDAVYEGLYKNIYSWLRPGGVFACCDAVEGDNPEVDALNLAGWRRYLSKNLTATDVKGMLSHYRREDSPISLRKHLLLLEKAGFSCVDILWKRFNFAVYMAVK